MDSGEAEKKNIISPRISECVQSHKSIVTSVRGLDCTLEIAPLPLSTSYVGI
ncbi:hypothetical protein J6590_086353 [Homalodisca vitripennis]|nr:hypothetical protein J6590_086353 [Homalodisca vitripennis]